MSSSSSLIIDDDLDVDEGAVVKTVQSSMFELKNPSVISEIMPAVSESPEPGIASRSLMQALPVIEERKPEDNMKENEKQKEISFEDDIIMEEIAAKEDAQKKEVENNQPKNFVQKNIEVMRKKKSDYNIDGVNIDELCLEEEFEKRVPVDVDERFYKYQNKVKEKIQSLANELKEKEMEKCTFKPDVKSQKQRRTTDQFLAQMKSYEKLKNDKIEVLRSQKKDAPDEMPNHHPHINQKSKEILAKRGESNEPIYEKLYQKSKNKKVEKSPPKQAPAKPVTKRAEPIEKILYDDALRRAAKKEEVKVISKESQISAKSQQVLAKKFMKEFQDVIIALDFKEELIAREEAVKVLVCLNFIRNNPEHPKYIEEKATVDKFFKIINAESSVKLSNMLRLSLAVLNIYLPTMTLSLETENGSGLGFMVDGNLSVSKEEVLKIHKQFIVFYDNRQLSTQVIKNIAAEEFPFKPVLNPETEAIAKHVQKRAGSLYSLKREEFLQEEKKRVQERIEKIKKEKEEQEAKLCTFKPTLITKSHSKAEISEKDRAMTLYEKYKDIKEKKDKMTKSINEQEKEKDMSECTFAPRLEKIKVKEEKEILQSKSVQNQILRMQKAREEQERKKNILEKPPTGKNLNFGVDYSHKTKSSFKPPSPQLKQKQLLKSTVEKLETYGYTPDLLEHALETEEQPIEPKNNNIYPKDCDTDDEEIQLNVKMPDGNHKMLIIPPGSDKELRLSMFILENKLSEELGKKLRLSIMTNS